MKYIVPFVFLKASQSLLVLGGEGRRLETDIRSEAKRDVNRIFGRMDIGIWGTDLGSKGRDRVRRKVGDEETLRN